MNYDQHKEALKLADELNLIAGMISIGDRIKWGQDSDLMEKGSDMIRKLLAELDKQEKANKVLEEGYGCDHAYFIDKSPQTKPLSDEEIIQVRQTTKANNTDNWADSLAFARAIEERHGIK